MLTRLATLQMLQRGDWIGDEFEILELLGRGGMGEVYAARQPRLQCLRAIKVPLPDRACEPEARARFHREAAYTGRILSDHVVQMIRTGFDEVRQLPWLAMEYLDGANLRRAVARFGLPPHEPCLELLRQVFHGVAAAHEAAITHRDLKPENIFVARGRRADAPFTVKVLDFGIAWSATREAPTAPLGTPAWCAPEQLRGEPVSPATDVYALGLIVFWLLCGQSYTRSEAAGFTVPASVRAGELGCTATSEHFDEWFARCLAPEPKHRFTDAKACWRALSALWPTLGAFSGGVAWSELSSHLAVRSHEDAPTTGLAYEPDAGKARRPNRVFNLPQAARSFVGRNSELEWLKAELLRRDVRVCAGVEGLPGIGKTELALQLAQRLAREGAFPGGIYWLPAEQGDLTRAWASDDIAGALGVQTVGVGERALAAVRALSSQPDPVLVILDNVESWTESDAPHPLPSGIHVSILITTRGHRVGGSRFHSLALGFLPEADARHLLQKTAGNSCAERPGFAELLDYLGGYTLAIELAGAYLAEFPEVSPAGYLERLRGSEPEERVAEFTRYERTVRQTFRELWQRLEAPLRRAWLLAARFAPEPASVELSEAVGLHSEERNALRRLHLIEADEQGDWRMHRLVRGFALDAASPEELEPATQAFLAGARARMKGLQLMTGYRVYGPDRAHLDNAVTLARQCPYTEAMGEMIASVASGLHSLGELERAREHFEWVLAGDRALLGEEDAKVATLRSNLALVLQDMGELDLAREHLLRALDSDLRGRPEDTYKLLLRRSNLARLLHERGELQEAREILTSALEVALPTLGDAHALIAIARSNLAWISCDLGEWDDALENISKALDSDRARNGDDHPSVAIRRTRLGVVLAARGELDAAERELREALRVELATIGSEHPRVALLRAHLCNLLHRRGLREGATLEAQEALRVAQRQRPGSPFRKGVERLLAVRQGNTLSEPFSS